MEAIKSHFCRRNFHVEYILHESTHNLTFWNCHIGWSSLILPGSFIFTGYMICRSGGTCLPTGRLVDLPTAVRRAGHKSMYTVYAMNSKWKNYIYVGMNVDLLGIWKDIMMVGKKRLNLIDLLSWFIRSFNYQEKMHVQEKKILSLV